MKPDLRRLLFITTLSLFVFAGSAHARGANTEALDYEEYDQLNEEQTAELLNTPDEFAPPNSVIPELQNEATALLKDKGKWSFKFVWEKLNGESVLLSEQNADQLIIPASAQKVVTGWYAYKNLNTPLVDLSVMLHKSNGPMANAMFAQAGGGYPSKATAVIKTYLKEKNGLDFTNTLFMKDGDGKDATLNRVNSSSYYSLLKYIYLSPDYAPFKVLLAQPDEPSTLKSEGRLSELGGKLYAKTGTMPKTRVASLIGYVETANGTLIFSIMGNKYFLPAMRGQPTNPHALANRYEALEKAREYIDRLVRSHTAWVEKQSSNKLPFNPI